MVKKVIELGLGLALTMGCPPLAGASDTAERERGKEVYRAQRCATCHAIEGAGNRRHPLDGVGTRLTPDVIRTWIVAPQQMNPKVRKKAYVLPAEDLDALVAYLASLKAP